MKRASQVFGGMVVAFLAAVVIAAPTAGSSMSGASPQTLTLSQDAQVLLQCPGQIVQLRGMNAADVHDAGQNDMRIDFITNPDPIPVGLTGIQTKLGLRNADGGTVACDYAPAR